MPVVQPSDAVVISTEEVASVEDVTVVVEEVVVVVEEVVVVVEDVGVLEEVVVASPKSSSISLSFPSPVEGVV